MMSAQALEEALAEWETREPSFDHNASDDELLALMARWMAEREAILARFGVTEEEEE